MKVRNSSRGASSEVSIARKVITIGAIGLVSTLGVAIPAGAVNLSSTQAHVTLSAHAATTKKVTKITHVAFKGAYSGTIALLWSSTGVTATSVAGHGTGTYGSNTMKGSGGGSAASTCNPFAGTGKFKGATGTLSFKGSFSVQSSTAGSSESDAFNATLTGTVTIKKVTVVAVKK